MSEVKVNKVSPRSGTTVTIGDSGDTINLVGTLQNNGSPLAGDISSVVAGTGLSGGATSGVATLNIEAAQPTITSLGTITGFTSTGIDDNATSTAITIDSNEKLQVNTSGKTSYLNVNSAHDSGVSSFKTLRLGDTGLRQHWTLDNDNGTVAYFSTNGNSLIQNANANLMFYTNGTERMRIHSTGVGIGTSSPSEELEVSGSQNTIIKSKTTTSTALGGFEAHSSGGTSYIKVHQLGPSFGGTTFGGVTGNDQSLIEAQGASSLAFSTQGGTPDIIFAPARTARMTIKNGGNVGIGTSSPDDKFHVMRGDSGGTAVGGSVITAENGGNCFVTFLGASTSNCTLFLGDNINNNAGQLDYDHANDSMSFYTNQSEKVRITSAGSVGIGTTSPQEQLDISSTGPRIRFSDTSVTNLRHVIGSEANDLEIRCDDGNVQADSHIGFKVDGSEKMRIDSSGNLLVGTTSTTPATGTSSGNLISAIGRNQFSSDSDTLEVNRHGSEGIIVSLRKDGTRISTIRARSTFGVYVFGSLGTGIGGTSTHSWLPMVNNTRSNNQVSLGQASYKMTELFATNGNINTSDQNEKQSIQSLTTAEMNVGKKLSSLIKTYKWNSSVEEKGDNARTHTGIIAQDVQQAFNDEGLDASKYSLWCSDTWSIDADGERIENPEEEIENNPTKNILGIRYDQLLSFIQAYNDQRFTELEARITTLENA